MSRSLRGNTFLICALTAWSAGASHVAHAEDLFAPGNLIRSIQQPSPKKADFGSVSEDESNKNGIFIDSLSTLIPPPTNTPYDNEPSGAQACAVKKVLDSPWRSGYREALAGRRVGLPIPNGFDIGSKSSTTNKQRQACSAYRIKKDAPNLACCLAGYQKAIPLLTQQIKEWKNAEPSVSPEQEKCLANYKMGKDAAADKCEKMRKEATRCDWIKIEPVRYLGCFSLGFWNQMHKCKQLTKQGKFLRELEANGGIADIDEKKVFEGPTSTEPSNSSSAIGAQGGVSNP